MAGLFFCGVRAAFGDRTVGVFECDRNGLVGYCCQGKSEEEKVEHQSQPHPLSHHLSAPTASAPLLCSAASCSCALRSAPHSHCTAPRLLHYRVMASPFLAPDHTLPPRPVALSSSLLLSSIQIHTKVTNIAREFFFRV